MAFALSKLHAEPAWSLPIPNPNGANAMKTRLLVLQAALKTLFIIALWAAAFCALYVCMTAMMLG